MRWTYLYLLLHRLRLMHGEWALRCKAQGASDCVDACTCLCIYMFMQPCVLAVPGMRTKGMDGGDPCIAASGLCSVGSAATALCDFDQGLCASQLWGTRLLRACGRDLLIQASAVARYSQGCVMLSTLFACLSMATRAVTRVGAKTDATRHMRLFLSGLTPVHWRQRQDVLEATWRTVLLLC